MLSVKIDFDNYFYRVNLGVCLVYINENKPRSILRKTKKHKAFWRDKF